MSTQTALKKKQRPQPPKRGDIGIDRPLYEAIERERVESREIGFATRWAAKDSRDSVVGLGSRLRALRISRGLSQTALSERSRVAPNKIVAIELERHKGGLTFQTAIKLAVTLDTTLDYLAGLSNDPTPRR